MLPAPSTGPVLTAESVILPVICAAKGDSQVGVLTGEVPATPPPPHPPPAGASQLEALPGHTCVAARAGAASEQGGPAPVASEGSWPKHAAPGSFPQTGENQSPGFL